MISLSDLFESYSKEACRLEVLPQYNVPGEWESFQNFLQTGVAVSPDRFLSYKENVAEKIKGGAEHIRIRIVEDPPIPYQIFETKIGYIPLSSVGAKVYLLGRTQYETLAKSWGDIPDFWVFDNQHCATMQYDAEGKWLGAEIVSPPGDILFWLDIRDTLIKNAISLDSFIKKNNAFFI